MQIFLYTVQIIASLFLILVVLLQSGRGGGMGAAFGGASGQIFGGRGAGNFLSRVTAGAATVFFVSSLGLSMLSSRHRSVVRGGATATAATTAPDDGAADPPKSTPAAAADGPAPGAAPAPPPAAP